MIAKDLKLGSMSKLSKYIQAVSPKIDWMTADERNDAFLTIAGGDHEDRLWLFDYLYHSGWNKELSVPMTRLWAKYDELECGRLLVSTMPEWWIDYSQGPILKCVPERATKLRMQASYYYQFFKNYYKTDVFTFDKSMLRLFGEYLRILLVVQPYQLVESGPQQFILQLCEKRHGDLEPEDFSIRFVGEAKTIVDTISGMGYGEAEAFLNCVDRLASTQIHESDGWNTVRTNPLYSDYRKAIEYWRIYASMLKKCIRKAQERITIGEE